MVDPKDRGKRQHVLLKNHPHLNIKVLSIPVITMIVLIRSAGMRCDLFPGAIGLSCITMIAIIHLMEFGTGTIMGNMSWSLRL
jgi:hypothetical protein